jgi:hypothetical protein
LAMGLVQLLAACRANEVHRLGQHQRGARRSRPPPRPPPATAPRPSFRPAPGKSSDVHIALGDGRAVPQAECVPARISRSDPLPRAACCSTGRHRSAELNGSVR